MSKISWYESSSPETQAKILCYPRMFDIPWLSFEKVSEGLDNPTKSLVKELSGSVANLYKKETHKTFEPVKNYWESVPLIPKNDLNIVVPLRSKPANAEDYSEEIVPDIYNDPLSKSMVEITRLAEYMDGVWNEIKTDYDIIFLDYKLLPVPLNKGRVLPRSLISYYIEHQSDPFVFRPKDTLEKMLFIIKYKKKRGIELDEDEKMLDSSDKNFEQNRRIYLNRLQKCVSIIKNSNYLQLKEYFSDTGNVFIYGPKGDLDNFELLARGFDQEKNLVTDIPNPDIFMPSSWYINPYEGISSSEYKFRIAKAGITHPLSLKRLGNLIKTKLGKKSGLLIRS